MGVIQDSDRITACEKITAEDGCATRESSKVVKIAQSGQRAGEEKLKIKKCNPLSHKVSDYAKATTDKSADKSSKLWNGVRVSFRIQESEEQRETGKAGAKQFQI